MEEKRRKLILEGSIGKAFVSLAMPIVLTNMLQVGYQLTDAFWVGRLGANAVAALSIGFPMTFLILALGSGLSFAGQTLSAQYMGAGRKDLIDHLAGQTMLMVTIIGTILGFIGYVLSPLFLEWLGVTPEVHEGALGFMRVSFMGIVFTYIYLMFQSLMRGVGRNNLPLMIIAGSVLLNFILDPFFIFGFMGFEGQGVMGAAYATLVTQALAALVSILVFLHGWHGIHISWKSFKPDFAYIKKVFILGFPSSVELSSRALSATFFPCLATSFGTLATAAYGAGNTVMQVIIMLSIGLSITVSTMVGQNLGAGKKERAVDIANFVCAITFLIVTCFGAFSFMFAENLVRFFIPNDHELIAESCRFIRFMSLLWGLVGVQICIFGIFRAAGNMKMSMNLTLVSQWIVQLPLAYILSKYTSLGLDGLWWSFPITIIIMSFITLYAFIRSDWQHIDMSSFHKHEAKKP